MLPDRLARLLHSKSPSDGDYAVQIVDALLDAARLLDASDVHLLPQADGLYFAWRLDGVLNAAGVAPSAGAAQIVARLKVLARLLTYETQVPQEGRIPAREDEGEVRLSTFPTLFGEKVVIRRLSASREQLARVGDLGLPQAVVAKLQGALAETSGAILLVGPAGSGKSTTAYACLREILSASARARSIASLEDPVEVVVPGVAQSQMAPAAGFDHLAGLRSLVRQDPEVIFVGEMRDAPTAAVAMQAAMTGQLLLTTFHADSAASALSRLADMDLPPYVLRSAIRLVVAQRLLRRLCRCAVPAAHQGDAHQGAAHQGVMPRFDAERVAVGCPECRHTGYAGRLAVAEWLSFAMPGVSEGVLARVDAQTLTTTAVQAGMLTLVDQAAELVASGVTSRAEAVRTLGLVAAC